MSTRVNRFADILDLDRLAGQIYDTSAILRMGNALREALLASDPSLAGTLSALSAENVASLFERAEYGGIGLPYLVNRAVVEGGLHV